MKMHLGKMFMGSLFGASVILVLMCVYFVRFVLTFSNTSKLSIPYLVQTAKIGYQQQDHFQNTSIRFLLLGLDNRSDELENTLLTDTIMFGSLDTTTGRLSLLSIPRDLWIDELKTKINALYYYGTQNDPSNPISYVSKEIAAITGFSPQYTIVLNYRQLPELIDHIGGLDIIVEQSFVDHEYPNPLYIKGVDATESAYTSISFKKGVEHMNGDRALKFIRSRGSTDLTQGSDEARSRRQFIVFEALLAKLRSRDVLQNPKTLGILYRYFKDNVQTQITDSQLISLGVVMRNHELTIKTITIPTALSDTTIEALLMIPPVKKYGQWVFEPKDPTWEELKGFVKNNL